MATVSDNFTYSDGDLATVSSGAFTDVTTPVWRVESNRAVYRKSGSGSTANFAISSTAMSSGDHYVAATVQVESASNVNVGVALRWSGDDGWIARIPPSGRLEICRVDNGVVTVVANTTSAAWGGSAGVDYTLQFEANGSSLLAFVPELGLAVTASSSTYSAQTGVGLYGDSQFDVDAFVDNFSAGAISDIPPGPPVYIGAGTGASGTGGITPSFPTGLLVDDILLLILETNNQAIAISSAGGGTWTELSSSPQGVGSAAGAGGNRLTLFWSRYNGSQTAPTTTDSGAHQLGFIGAFRRCLDTGDPINATAGSTDGTGPTTLTLPSVTTTVDDCLVALLVTDGWDNSSVTRYSAWTNANLTQLIERIDAGIATGFGGGVGIAMGVKTTAGATGTSTVDQNASIPSNTMITLALAPIPQSPPDDIDDLTADPGDTEVDLSWTAPADNGSAITDYEYRVDGGTWTSTGSATPGYTVTGLTNGVEYDFEVRAVNAVGDSGASNLVSATPSGGTEVTAVATATWSGWTAAATATKIVTATATRAWSGWTAAATANKVVSATATGTWSGWTANATANHSVSATAATATWSGWTAQASASKAVTSSANATWAGWTAAATATRSTSVSASAAWGGWTAAATIYITVGGLAIASWGGWTASASANRSTTSVTGSAVWSGWTAAATATRSTTNVTGQAVWGGWTASAVAGLELSATANATWAGWTAVATAIRETEAVAHAAWAGWTASAIALSGNNAVGAAAWAGWLAEADAERSIVAAAQAAWGGWTALATVQRTVTATAANASWGAWTASAAIVVGVIVQEALAEWASWTAHATAGDLSTAHAEWGAWVAHAEAVIVAALGAVITGPLTITDLTQIRSIEDVTGARSLVQV